MEIYNRENDDLIENIKEHSDLIIALASGLVILLAWRMDFSGLTTASVLAYLSAFLIGGYKKAKEGIHDTIYKKHFNVKLLMVLAAIGSAISGYWIEGAILIFIFALCGALETYTLKKYRKRLSNLLKLIPEEAWLVRGAFEPMKIPVNTITVGDHLLIKSGERIPADGYILKGVSTIDESVINDEATPKIKQIGDEVFAGTMNLNGTIKINVTKPLSDTLLQQKVLVTEFNQCDKLKFQQVIERMEAGYTLIVLFIFISLMFIPTFSTTLYNAIIFLTIASPIPFLLRIGSEYFKLVQMDKEQ